MGRRKDPDEIEAEPDEKRCDGKCGWCQEKAPLDEQGFCSAYCSHEAGDLNGQEPGSLFDAYDRRD